MNTREMLEGQQRVLVICKLLAQRRHGEIADFLAMYDLEDHVDMVIGASRMLVNAASGTFNTIEFLDKMHKMTIEALAEQP